MPWRTRLQLKVEEARSAMRTLIYLVAFFVVVLAVFSLVRRESERNKERFMQVCIEVGYGDSACGRLWGMTR